MGNGSTATTSSHAAATTSSVFCSTPTTAAEAAATTSAIGTPWTGKGCAVAATTTEKSGAATTACRTGTCRNHAATTAASSISRGSSGFALSKLEIGSHTASASETPLSTASAAIVLGCRGARRTAAKSDAPFRSVGAAESPFALRTGALTGFEKSTTCADQAHGSSFASIVPKTTAATPGSAVSTLSAVAAKSAAATRTTE